MYISRISFLWSTWSLSCLAKQEHERHKHKIQKKKKKKKSKKKKSCDIEFCFKIGSIAFINIVSILKNNIRAHAQVTLAKT